MDVSFNPIKYNNYLKTNQNVCFKGTSQNSGTKEVSDDIFFVNMKAYGTNSLWAAKMNVLMHRLSNMISENESFWSVLGEAEDGIFEINGLQYGIKRMLDGFFCIENGKRGTEYLDRYKKLLADSENETFTPKSNEEYKDAKTCKITPCNQNNYEVKIAYGFDPCSWESNLKLAALAYEKLKSIENPTIDDINKCCATINWLIAQENPYIKGSDSMASLLTKAIYHSYNIQPQALKSGKSLDFEAFCSDLDEYIENYPDLFKERPKFRDEHEP